LGRSCNGNGNLLRELGRRPLWDAAPHLIAVLDSDKLHKLWAGASRQQVADPDYEIWATQMEAKCRERLGPHDAARLTICFLDRNLETLLNVLGDTSLEKDVVQRDKVLQRAGADPGAIRRGMDGMPTWAKLVDTVAGRLAPRSP
jgi:hypothetical protein